MARGVKTGGRNFEKGNPGKPMGAKDRVPRSFKQLYRHILEDKDNSEAVEARVLKGLLGRDGHRWAAIGASLEAKQVELMGNDERPLRIVHEHRDS